MLTYLNLVLIVVIALILSGFMQYHDHEPTGVEYGDKVCIEGGGWFLDGMRSPQPFLVCGFLEEFNPAETAPKPPEYPKGDFSLSNLVTGLSPH